MAIVTVEETSRSSQVTRRDGDDEPQLERDRRSTVQSSWSAILTAGDFRDFVHGLDVADAPSHATVRLATTNGGPPCQLVAEWSELLDPEVQP